MQTASKQTLRYRITARKNSINGKKDQYILQAVNTGQVDLEQLCQAVAKRCSLSSGDVQHAVVELAQLCREHLTQGRIVNLGELGRYKMGFQCKAEDHPDKLSPKSIKKFHLNFQPGKTLKQMLKAGLKVRREETKQASLPRDGRT